MATAAMLFVALVSTVVFLAWLRRNSNDNKIQAERIQLANSQIAELKSQGEAIQQEMTPPQRAQLAAAHRLIANKRFGWSRLFADLEAVLPNDVSASRIAVQNIYTSGDKIKAELEFSVLSHDYSSVSTMIQNMQNSGMFLAELKGQDLQKTDRSTFTEYTLRLIYSPTYSISSGSDVAQNIDGGQR